MLTLEQAQNLRSLTANDVVSVYSGKPGCACGCNGNYRYAAKYAAEAGKDRGYVVDADEVNDKQVRRVLKLLQTADLGDSTWLTSKDGEWYSVTLNGRVYTVYTTAYVRN